MRVHHGEVVAVARSRGRDAEGGAGDDLLEGAAAQVAAELEAGDLVVEALCDPECAAVEDEAVGVGRLDALDGLGGTGVRVDRVDPRVGEVADEQGFAVGCGNPSWWRWP